MASNFLDIAYVVITCLSLASGLYSGAVKLIIGFIFFMLSFLFAYLIFVPVTDVMHEYVTSHFMVNIISISISYLVCAIFCAIIASKLKAFVADISGGVTDRFLGLALGGARGLLVSLILFTSVIIFTSKSYAIKNHESAKNLLDLVQANPKTNPSVESPHWVASSKFNPNLRQLLDKAIDFIGKESLKKIMLPKYETSSNPIEPKDPFEAIEKSH